MYLNFGIRNLCRKSDFLLIRFGLENSVFSLKFVSKSSVLRPKWLYIYENILLLPLCSTTRSIKKEKFKDMTDLLPYNPQIYHEYYKNLKTQIPSCRE